jgi:hypothetical protein
MNKICSFLAVSSFFIASSAFSASTEMLMGVTYDSQGVTYQVFSGGCTSKRSFSVTLLETDPVGLVLTRTSEDFCEAYLPYGVTLTYSYAELGLASGDSFVIKNPLSNQAITVD